MDTERAPLAFLVAPQHTAVLVVDVEPLFTRGTRFPPMAEMLPRLRRFLDAAKAAGALRVFIRGVIPQERWVAGWREFPAEIRVNNSPGSPLNEYHADFRPEAGDLTLVKERYSAFIGTELEALLRGRGIETVIVAGLTTDICVSSTARDAFQRDFYTVTLADCSAAGSVERQEVSLQILANNFGRVCTAEEVLAAWQVQPALAAAPAQ
jgi:ureidoacrylate peracid hydrolase